MAADALQEEYLLLIYNVEVLFPSSAFCESSSLSDEASGGGCSALPSSLLGSDEAV